jgi:hypothetical protein
MISVQANFAKMKKDMDNLISYSSGFIEGAQAAKPQMLNRLGEQVSEVISQHIDSIASANPSILHHVYEWGRAGNAASRLFDIDYIVKSGGISLNATFSQSSSVQAGSTVPFYNKAYIMENGIPVRIQPKTSQVLAFTDNGEQVFTKKEVVVAKPGGEAVAGSFENTFDSIVRVYLSQAIFDVTDVGLSVKNVRIFKDNLKKGIAGGRSVGVSTGKKWITGGVL